MGLRLALYSDQTIPSNAAVDRRLLKLIGTPRPRIGYVSSAPDPLRTYFSAKRKYYESLGAELCSYVDEEMIGQTAEIENLLRCDAIQLTGGNTYRFLRWLTATGLLSVLRGYAMAGGVLIGTSAGSLLMAQNISIARLSPDDARDGPKSLDALALVDFQFWPHYQPGQEREAKATAFLTFAPLVYACPDGTGIVVNEGDIELIGDIKLFRYGKIDA